MSRREHILAILRSFGPLPASDVIERTPGSSHEEVYGDLVALEALHKAKVVAENSGFGPRQWRAA